MCPTTSRENRGDRLFEQRLNKTKNFGLVFDPSPLPPFARRVAQVKIDLHHVRYTNKCMPNKSRCLEAVAVFCILLLISSVTAVPIEASESTKDLIDAEELAKSVAVDITPRVGADGKTTLGVALGSTDARYRALNGKTFDIDPKKTDGGVDFAVGSTDGNVAGLLSGKSARIPRTLDGAPITDPTVIDSAAFDRMALSQVSGLVADKPIRAALDSDYSVLVTSVGDDSAATAGTTYRQAVADFMFAAPRGRDSGLGMLATSLNAADGSTTTPQSGQTWWQWTKQKVKNAWSTTKNGAGRAWNATKEFVKEHWVAILIVVIVLIIVTVIVLILLWLFFAPPPVTAPPVAEAVERVLLHNLILEALKLGSTGLTVF
jgi:hypothetical protein